MKLEENYQTPIFREVQGFHPLLYILVVVYALSIWVLAFIQLILKVPIGNKPTPDTLILVIFFLLGVILPFIFLKMKLITEIRSNGIYLKFFPFHFKWQVFLFEDIKKAELIKYSPLKDYGGWGIRYGKKGKAYNTKGNMGIMLEFKNGKNLLIGTQKGEEFINTLSPYIK